MPDGTRYFSIARTVAKPGHGYHKQGQAFAIALGCEIAYAAQLVYADGIDLVADEIAVPIGLHCRLCERPGCSQRAVPPVNHRLVLDEGVRGPTTYVFEPLLGEHDGTTKAPSDGSGGAPFRTVDLEPQH